MLHTLESDQKGYVKEYDDKDSLSNILAHTNASVFRKLSSLVSFGFSLWVDFLLRLAGLYDGNTLFFVILDKSQASKNPV